jgi:ribonuclease HII
MYVFRSARGLDILTCMIVGIDEVGRGCWAGPLVAGAVKLAEPIPGLKDSKLLSKSQRNTIASLINKNAASVGIGWATPREVDAHGLTAATRLAMERALAHITIPYKEIIIDGNYNYLTPNCVRAALTQRVRTVVGADRTVPAVSAASIVAKVARNRYMAEAARIYPQYQFEKHVGYGTSLHLERLKLHGKCDLHRLSYKPIRSLNS